VDIEEIRYKDEECIHLPQDTVQWQAFMNTGMDTWSSVKGGESLDWLNDC
jgi:hypothetical protein